MPDTQLGAGMGRDASSYYSLIGRLSAIITILPASMIAGGVVGHYVVDRLFDTTPWGAIIFILAGAGAGFYEIARILATPRRDEPDGPNHDGS
jgi:F0F1-type ATP synthase assembly protein I